MLASVDRAGEVDLAIVAVPAPAVPESSPRAAARASVASSSSRRASPRPVRTGPLDASRPSGPRQRHADRRPQLLRSCQHRRRRLDERHLRQGPADRGAIGFVSQSGGLGIAILAEAKARGIGLSSFVSMGNKADVSGNDLLSWWEEDDATRVVLLYLESFGNPKKFARIASESGGRSPSWR